MYGMSKCKTHSPFDNVAQLLLDILWIKMILGKKTITKLLQWLQLKHCHQLFCCSIHCRYQFRSHTWLVPNTKAVQSGGNRVMLHVMYLIDLKCQWCILYQLITFWFPFRVNFDIHAKIQFSTPTHIPPVMISVEQIGASLPTGSEDPTKVCLFSKIKQYD